MPKLYTPEGLKFVAMGTASEVVPGGGPWGSAGADMKTGSAVVTIGAIPVM